MVMPFKSHACSSGMVPPPHTYRGTPTSRQLKNPYGFFAPYIPTPKGGGFTARLVKIFLFFFIYLLDSFLIFFYN
jgi:hypothetical protein